MHLVGGSGQHRVVARLRAVGRVEACGREGGRCGSVAVRVERQVHAGHLLLLEHDGGLLVHGVRRRGRGEHGLRDVLGLLLVDGSAALRVQNVRGNGLGKVVHVLGGHLRVVLKLLLLLLGSVVVHGRLHGSLGHILVFHWVCSISVSLEDPRGCGGWLRHDAYPIDVVDAVDKLGFAFDCRGSLVSEEI